MRKKKFTIPSTPERSELFKLMASDDVSVAYNAQVSLATFLRPIVQRLIDQKATVSDIFRTEVIAKGAPQTIPIDPYADYHEGDFHVWSTTKAGGLATQTVEGLSEYPFTYSNLDSALYLDKSYVENARLDLMAKAMNRVVQEFVAKKERLGWTAILTALAAGTNTNGKNHVIAPTTAGRLQPADFNALRTLVTRLYQSFAGGSIAGDYGLTDMYLSPERMADLRALAYNPVNTIVGPTVPTSTLSAYTATNAIPLPDSVREGIFNGAGLSVFQGITLHELRELGLGRKLNVIFDAVSTNTPTYDNTTEDLVIGMDLSQDNCVSPTEGGADGNSTVSVKVDNQFYATRMEKLGWYFRQNVGYIVTDNRFIVAVKI